MATVTRFWKSQGRLARPANVSGPGSSSCEGTEWLEASPDAGIPHPLGLAALQAQV